MKNWTLKGLAAGKATTKWPASGENDGQEEVLGFPTFHPEDCDPKCRECVQRCPTRAFSTKADVQNEETVTLDYGRCINCQLCVTSCPTTALQSSSNFTFASKSRQDLFVDESADSLEIDELQIRISSHFKGSLHVRHVDAGSCNGCESELQALSNPFYNLHRLGIFFTPSPRFADVLLVTGPVVPQMKGPLLRTYEAMPRPRFVIAGGTCPISGAPFDLGYSGGSGLGIHLPVDISIPGCPPTPAAFIHGLLLLTDRINQRLHGGQYEQ